jgi:phosphogluconate dehydratase
VFEKESDVKVAFALGELDRDVAVVVRNQGPMANGMPELHSLTPILDTLQDRGHKVLLMTDGRMSGASGRVPAAIHITPEAMSGGGIGRIKNGDLITLDATMGLLSVDADLEDREFTLAPVADGAFGRALFADMRDYAAPAEQGGGINMLRRYS